MTELIYGYLLMFAMLLACGAGPLILQMEATRRAPPSHKRKLFKYAGLYILAAIAWPITVPGLLIYKTIIPIITYTMDAFSKREEEWLP